MRGPCACVAYLLLLLALPLATGCTPPASEPPPPDGSRAISSEDFESGSVESLQQGPAEDEEGEAEGESQDDQPDG